MTKFFFVDLEMCGGETLPADFDLEDFCEKLQGKISDVEILPASSLQSISNKGSSVISPHLLNEALGEYYPR